MTSGAPGVSSAVLLCLLAVAACGSPAPAAGAPAAPAPLMSSTEARDILTAYDGANNQVNAAADLDGLPRIETTPLARASSAEMQVRKLLKQPPPLLASTDPRFAIPFAAAGQPWFVATSTRLRGDVVATNQSYLVFSRRDQNSPWLAAYSLTLPTGVQAPAFALNGSSAATAVTDFGDLRIRPGELAERNFNHYVKNLAGKDGFGRSVALDGQLAKGYQAASEILRDRGTRFTRTPGGKVTQVFALRTDDGGALVFSAGTVVDVLSPLRQPGTVSLSRGSNEAALAGNASGMTAAKLTITRQQSFLTHIPSRASGNPVNLLAYTDFPISICWQPDPKKEKTRCSK
ncbi:MAG TPA: hypothetical protein VI248_17590 [Kineosporiaceae bacterium]